MAKTAFLFPGQGAQFVGMGRELAASRPTAKALFDRASEILGYDLLKVCAEGPAERLNATDVSQPAIYVASLAALETLREDRPELVESCAGAAGLSLGEYTALAFAGSLDFETGLRVVRLRGEAMQAAALATPGGMASLLGADEAAVDAVLERVASSGAGRLWKANLLCPGNTVVSGDAGAIAAVEEVAGELGAGRVVKLAVAGAFHTPLMKPADDRLAEALAGVALGAPRIPVYSNVDARPHDGTDPEGIKAKLVRQVLASVLWESSMRAMIADGFDDFHEIGPGRALAGMLKRIDRKIPCANVASN